MSEINDADNPRCPAYFTLDCELLSTASFSPEDGSEGVNASVPNVENKAATASTLQPISSLRVSFLGSLIQIPYISHF
jgi:hypothetical protein